MMTSPGNYIKRLKDAPYTELIKERDELIESIRKFEKAELAGDRSDPAWGMCPSPDVQYQCDLEYLSELCNFMQEKYNNEYVWEDRTLKQDADVSDLHDSARASDSKKAEQDFIATLELMKDICRPAEK
ncbi:MAG: hypothetical protein K6F61_07690 [Clostridiales bacterium]|nr:hypothetical protein [Clostridiales bacterium]